MEKKEKRMLWLSLVKWRRKKRESAHLYPATHCCGSVWLNGKERKEKAPICNMYNFTMLVGKNKLYS
jgi:hypothetical protein